MSAARLSRIMVMEKSTVSRDLARMDAAGWIKRRSLNGRGQKLALTPRGRRLLADALPLWEKAQAAARHRFGGALSEHVPGLAARASVRTK